MRAATDSARPRPWLATLRSKVARRVILLFFLCAVLPMALVGVVSYGYVGGQLTSDAEIRVERGAKLSGQTVIERLLTADALLRSAAERLAARVPAASESVGTRINAVRWDSPSGTRPLAGALFPVPDLTAELRSRMNRGEAVMVTGPVAAGERSVLMVRRVGTAAGELWGRIDVDRVRENLPFAPVNASVCLFDQAVVIACDLPGAESFHAQLAAELTRHDEGLGPPLRVMRWHDAAGAEYVVGYWEMFLRPSLSAPSWWIAVAESRAAVLQPLSRFNRTFPIVLLLAILIVLLFSNVQIRRSLEPLTRLTAGTRRVALRDFSHPVSIRSGDEFQELAASFNAMAQRLDRQFRALEARSGIDRAVLASLDVERISATVVDEAPRAVGCDAVGIALAPVNGPGPWRVLSRYPPAPSAATMLTPDANDILDLERNPDARWVTHGPLPSYAAGPLTPLPGTLIVPVLLDRRAAGALLLGFRNVPADEDQVAARQMADQVAVALANARLLASLDRMNWGTAEALGRAIDAKSPWTAGHSGRVRALALPVGQQLGLDRAAMDDLHRGALLHDIGKIGIPNAVLDKAGPLTTEEQALMRSHVVIGAEILAPIPAYAGTLPVVLHHHERWDGSGYPQGLRGEDIPLLARVLTLPDVYDALTTDRPYRTGLSSADAVRHIREMTGRQFDARVAEAFLDALPSMVEGR